MSKRPWLLSVVAALAGVLAAWALFTEDAAPPPPPLHPPDPLIPLRPALVQIPAGTYTVGSPKEALTWEGPRRANAYEPPQRSVTVSGLWMCETEVTWAQYQAVMGENPELCQGGCASDQPVGGVGWEATIRYLNRLTILESLVSQAAGEPGLSQCYVQRDDDAFFVPGCTGYRLPTEDEWEVAARAGTTTSWAWGEDPEQADEHAWRPANSGRELQPVRRLAPNAWGLYDMAGNVSEWVWTPNIAAPAATPGPAWDLEYAEEWLWNKVIPGASPVILPEHTWAKPWRVNRGGSVWSKTADLRPASRDDVSQDAGGWNIGVRCARGPTP